MLVPFVVRLAPAALAAGFLAGEVEDVRTGARAAFRDAGELHTWCAALSAGQLAQPRVPPDRTAEPR